MKDLDIQITKDGIDLLKGLIGQEFVSMKHEKFRKDMSVFRRVELKITDGRYLINNDVYPYDDFVGMPDELPRLEFRRLKDEENPFSYRSEDKLSTETVKEKILDIRIITDRAETFDGEAHSQYMDASEGIIIITDKQQYGFFKETVWFDETIFIWEGENVIDHLEDLKAHWDIFAYPINAKVERFLLSLKTGVEQKLGEAEERGEAGKEEANS